MRDFFDKVFHRKQERKRLEESAKAATPEIVKVVNKALEEKPKPVRIPRSDPKFSKRRRERNKLKRRTRLAVTSRMPHGRQFPHGKRRRRGMVK